MNSRRQKKVAELIHQEISLLLQHRVRDPRLAFVTITGADVTADLRIAHVYFTLFDEAELKQTMQGLKKATPYLRRELGQTLKLRHVPELKFHFDNSIQYGQRIETLLDEILTEEQEPADSSE